MTQPKTQRIKLEDSLANNDNYKALWRAVIYQALLDIKSNSNKDISQKNRVKAIIWINLNKKAFLDVCERAEVNPERVYKYKLKILNEAS